MLNRTTFTCLLIAGLAALAGCRAGTSFSGSIDIAQWSPDFASSARKGSSSNFSLVGDGGVDADQDIWAFDLSLGMQAASGSNLKPYQLNIGYWRSVYEGVGLAPVSPITFFGADFDADPISTKADFKYYKLTFEEPDAKGNSAGGSLSSGILGIHYLDYNISADDGTNSGVFAGGAPMFVLGYRIEQYTKSGLIYYIRVEWMDLDSVTLGGVRGDIMDLSGGVRWAIRGDKAAICIGYRQLEADLDIDGNKLKIDMDGAIFSFFMRW
jgi:hypothetical protein